MDAIEPEPDDDVRDAIRAALSPAPEERREWGAAALREAVEGAVPAEGPSPL